MYVEQKSAARELDLTKARRQLSLLQTSLAVVVAGFVVVADVVVVVVVGADVVKEVEVEAGVDEVVEVVVEAGPLTATILSSRTALMGDCASTYILNTSSWVSRLTKSVVATKILSPPIEYQPRTARDLSFNLTSGQEIEGHDVIGGSLVQR